MKIEQNKHDDSTQHIESNQTEQDHDPESTSIQFNSTLPNSTQTELNSLQTVLVAIKKEKRKRKRKRKSRRKENKGSKDKK